MNNIKTKIFSLLLIVFFVQGCTYVDYFYIKKFKLIRDEKKELILKLIDDPLNYDSLIYNSRFYHKDYSKILFLEKNRSQIINALNYYKKSDLKSFSFYDNLNIDPETKFWEHEIIFLKEHDIKNLLSVTFIFDGSKWYITRLSEGSWEIQIRGLNESWNEF